MAFTVQDYHDLARLLWEHPEWREELRRLLLPDELLALPEVVRQLAEAQQRAEERLSQLEVTVQHLTEQVGTLTEQVGTLTEQVGTLTERQERLTDQVSALTKQVSALTEGQERLTERQQSLTDTVGGLKGQMLEITYRNRAFAYFGSLLRRAKVIELQTLEDELEAALTPDEFRDVLLLDLLVTGKLRRVPESPDIWLALEISSVVDLKDISRAVRRAGLLRQAGYRAVPVVAGEEATQDAIKAAQEQNVVLVRDGYVAFWKEALASWESIRLSEH